MLRSFFALILFIGTFVIFTLPASGHEAWLLTPSEIAELSVEPMPALFASKLVMSLVTFAAVIIAVIAIAVERKVLPFEKRLLAPISRHAAEYGPVFIRCGIAIMLGLGALGGLPRNGTALWAQPVLFVPDMQLSLVSGWEWLGFVEFLIAICLAVGILTRIAASLVVVLAVLGVMIFGLGFVSYAPHFIAPALVLIIYGSGAYGLDRLPQLQVSLKAHEHLPQITWRVVMFLVGATFAYLGIAIKLAEPTLLMAILEHGKVPRFGLPIEVMTLVMAMVEIIAGVLLAMGRLVRPVALFLIFAFTFFSVTIGETPLFHANLYGVALMLIMAGRKAPNLSCSKTVTTNPVRVS